MTKHTATPWQRNGHYIETVDYLPGSHCQLTICDLLGERGVAATEGDFIVRAANSHAALVAALRAVEWVRGVGQGEWCYVCMRQRGKGHAPDCQLDAALRAAEPD